MWKTILVKHSMHTYCKQDKNLIIEIESPSLYLFQTQVLRGKSDRQWCRCTLSSLRFRRVMQRIYIYLIKYFNLKAREYY